MGPRANLDVCGNSSPDGPACSQSLYRLSYPGPRRWEDNTKIDLQGKDGGVKLFDVAQTETEGGLL